MTRGKTDGTGKVACKEAIDNETFARTTFVFRKRFVILNAKKPNVLKTPNLSIYPLRQDKRLWKILMAFTIASATELMEEIKKSRFLTRAFPINSVTEAEAIIETIRKEEATHHCYAWKFHLNYRFNDDGEPTGTAGKPILNAIEGRDCDCVLVLMGAVQQEHSKRPNLSIL